MPRRLVRDTRQGMIGGVAAGFGQYLDVDPVLVRLGFVLLAFVHGLGLLLYLASWALMPRADAVEAAPAVTLTETGFETLRDAGSRFAEGVRSSTAGVGDVARSLQVFAPDTSQVGAVLGTLLIALGSLLLAHNLGWLRWPHWLSFETLWPLLLVALGVGLVRRSVRPRAA